MPHFELPVTDPVLILALLMLIILVVPMLFHLVRLPAIVGLILAGIVIGPNGLGILERGQTMILL
ncbi:MAG: hypothetical protein M3220_20985, partial [Chloroflexota bacterium]|nr:hypothetical protein [Chloroflexota bacterium]